MAQVARLGFLGVLCPCFRSAVTFIQVRRTTALCASEWTGLEAWRSAPLNQNRLWGEDGPVRLDQSSAPSLFFFHSGTSGQEERAFPSALGLEDAFNLRSLAEWGAFVLETSCPQQKSALTHQAFQLWSAGHLTLGVATAPLFPGRPLKPELVHPRDVPSLASSPLPENAHLLHNLAHIELNAINLAWDTVVRFSSEMEELGVQFFVDFAHVADDESRHLGWCLQRLNELGYSYGDLPAHNLLWKDCQKTSGDVKARLAVIPMTQEARGLDAGPRLEEKLVKLGDHRSAGIVQKIVVEELAHVAVGVSWFRTICKKLGANPEVSFRGVMEECNVRVRGPFNHQARAEAGIPREWYDTGTGPSKQLDLGEVAPKRKLHGRKGHGAEKDVDRVTAPTSSLVSEGNSDLQLVKDRLAMIVSLESHNIEPEP